MTDRSAPPDPNDPLWQEILGIAASLTSEETDPPSTTRRCWSWWSAPSPPTRVP